MENPFLKECTTPFGVPPFDEIKNEHFLPAIQEGMKAELAEIESITTNPEEPTFENTLAAMEKSGRLLSQVNRVFNALNGADTNEELQKISKETAPMLSKHSDDINLNEKLFQRIKILYDQIDNFDLSVEQRTVLEKYYKNFG